MVCLDSWPCPTEENKHTLSPLFAPGKTSRGCDAGLRPSKARIVHSRSPALVEKSQAEFGHRTRSRGIARTVLYCSFELLHICAAACRFFVSHLYLSVGGNPRNRPKKYFQKLGKRAKHSPGALGEAENRGLALNGSGEASPSCQPHDSQICQLWCQPLVSIR